MDTAPNLDIFGAEIAAAAAACRGCVGAIAAVVDSLARCWNAIDGEDIFFPRVELKETILVAKENRFRV